MLRRRWAERARRLIRSEVTSRGELGADPGEQRVDFCQGLLGRQRAERGIHIHLWPMAQMLRGAVAGSVMPHNVAAIQSQCSKAVTNSGRRS